MLRAAELTKDEPDSTIFEHIGDAHQALGQADKAKAAWQRAHELLDVQLEKVKAPDAYLFEQLGNVHHKLGQADEAKDAWQRSYEITPTESLREKLHPAKKEG